MTKTQADKIIKIISKELEKGKKTCTILVELHLAILDIKNNYVPPSHFPLEKEFYLALVA